MMSRLSHPGNLVRLNDDKKVVLSGIPMNQWEDQSLVPAGNKVFVQIVRECIINSAGKKMTQGLAEMVLEHEGVTNTLQFLVPLNENGEKINLQAADPFQAWSSRDELFIFESPKDTPQLKTFLDMPLKDFRPYIKGDDVDMNSRKYVVLSGLEVTKWDNKELAPAGNREFLQLTEEHLQTRHDSDKLAGAQAEAGHILKKEAVMERGFIFLLTMAADLGKKDKVGKGWKNKDLYVYTSPSDDPELKIKLKAPFDTLIKRMKREQSQQEQSSDHAGSSSVSENRNPTQQEPLPDHSSSTVTIKTRTNIICTRLQETVRKFQGELEELKTTFFNDRDWEVGCLKKLEEAQGAEKESWSKNWAEKLRLNDVDAMDHNDRRRTLTYFLKKVCDLSLDKKTHQIKEGQLEALKTLDNILPRIYHVCLPMDRANALYCLPNATLGRPGHHWYAKSDEEDLMELGVIPQNYKDKPTLNWRYLDMIASEVIGDDDREILEQFLTVTLCPLIPLDEGIIAQAKEAGFLDVREPAAPPDTDDDANMLGEEHDSSEHGRKRSRR